MQQLSLFWNSAISIALLLWKITVIFKTLASKKATTWRFQKPQSNYKLLRKIISSSRHME